MDCVSQESRFLSLDPKHLTAKLPLNRHSGLGGIAPRMSCSRTGLFSARGARLDVAIDLFTGESRVGWASRPPVCASRANELLGQREGRDHKK
jgi:hypothetical protein